MIDTTRVLRHLDDAEGAIDKLEDYQSAAELNSAVQSVQQAVDKTLRSWLRADPGATEEERLAAFSPSDLPPDRLIGALRRRNLISLKLAGCIHELDQAARRGREGSARASDAELARNAVHQLRGEVSQAVDQPVMQAAHNAVESRVLDQAAQTVPKNQSRRLLVMGGIGVLLVAALAAVFVLNLRGSEFEKGRIAFQAEQWKAAEEHFTKAAADDDNVAAQLYLARVYRTTNQQQRAADVLRKVAAKHPNDADVQRELGKLFVDRKQPVTAVKYLKRSLELDPDSHATWIWLIRALRAAGDPSAEQMLEQAPDEVRATLARPR
jgi:tetratricopeptide (TPR) repeat protein